MESDTITHKTRKKCPIGSRILFALSYISGAYETEGFHRRLGIFLIASPYTAVIFMTTEIDQLLIDWKNKIQIVSQNLFDFQELPTYQRLYGSPGFPKVHLTGITALRVTPALEAMNDLFQYFDLLVQTVDQASRLRQQLPRFLPTEQKIAEIKIQHQASSLLNVSRTHLSVWMLMSRMNY